MALRAEAHRRMALPVRPVATILQLKTLGRRPWRQATRTGRTANRGERLLEDDVGPTRSPGLLRRVGALLGKLGLLIGSVALTIGLGEVLTRWIRPQQLLRPASLYRAVDSLGYEHLPDLRVRVNTERAVDIITDREGYRVGAAGRTEAGARVLIIGDSFMEAIEVPYEASLAGLLQQSLPSAIGRPVAVRNAGARGYGPSRYRIATARALARERFDAVLVSLYTGNDISEERHDYYLAEDRSPPLRARWPRPWSLSAFSRSFLTPLILRAQRHSHLAVLIWNNTELLRIRLRTWEWAFPSVLLREQATSPAWDVTATICADLATVAREQGVAVRFVVIPQYLQLDSALTATYARAVGVDPDLVDSDQPNTRLVAALATKGLEVIDALPALRAAHRSGVNPYGRFDRHLSPEGHAVVARLVEPWLAEELRKRR